MTNIAILYRSMSCSCRRMLKHMFAVMDGLPVLHCSIL